MLQKLNERIQGVVAWLVIILIAITFTLFGVDYFFQSHQTSDAKAQVNDHPLSTQAFEVNYKRARAQQNLASMTAADDKKLQNQVLDQMIANEVTVQAARRYGFEISVEQANAAIVSIPQFQEDGHFSNERYQQTLNNALFTAESFQKEVRQGMLLNQQRSAFMASSFALPDEIKRFVNLYMQVRDYDYLIISPSQFESQATVSPEEISAYYATHKKEFFTPELVSVDYVTLSTADIKSQIKITEEDIKRYYEDNKNNFLTPAQWQVSHILFAVPEGASASEIASIQEKAESTYQTLVKNPEQFNDLAKKLSDDKLSLADNSVLPWITAVNKDYGALLSNVTQPGQISEPKKTKHGFEIFKLIAYKPVSTQSLAEVNATIKEQLTSEMAQAKYAQALEKLTDLSYQIPDSLVGVTDALKLPVQKSELFSRRGGSNPVTQNKLVIHAAFTHDVLELGNNSEPIQLDNDSVLVLRVNEHREAKEQKLSAVSDAIKNDLIKQRAQEMAKAMGSKLLEPLADKKQEDLIHANQLKWQTVSNASRDHDKDNSAINDLAFSLLKPENRNGITLPNDDYVVVRLKNIHTGDLSKLDKEQQESLVQHVESSYGMMDYDLYVNDLIRHAQIVKP
jgi:peptidyl-prolyl cis-trans isomerase D